MVMVLQSGHCPGEVTRGPGVIGMSLSDTETTCRDRMRHLHSQQLTLDNLCRLRGFHLLKGRSCIFQGCSAKFNIMFGGKIHGPAV